MATGYDVSNLSSYTKDSADKLSYLYKMIATGDSASRFKIQTGIKSSERIHILAASPVIQAQACGFTASANTTFSDRTITVAKKAVYMKFCEKDLEAFYTQLAMKPGSNLDTLTFAEQIVGDITQKISYGREVWFWQGDTLSTDQNLIHSDGLIKIINAASGVTTVTPQTWSVANSRTILQAFYAGLTNDMLAQPNGKIYMGLSEARDYRIKLGVDNLYHNDGKDSTLKIENTNIEIVPVNGLSGTKKIYFLTDENVILGTDLANEEDSYDLFYAKEAREIRFIAEWKEGVQIAHPTLIAQMRNT